MALYSTLVFGSDLELEVKLGGEDGITRYYFYPVAFDSGTFWLHAWTEIPNNKSQNLGQKLDILIKVFINGRDLKMDNCNIKWPEYITIEDGGYVLKVAAVNPSNAGFISRIGRYIKKCAVMQNIC